MTDRSVFKQVLNELDSPQRTALLYLEELIHLKHIEALDADSRIVAPNINLTPIHQKLQSLEYKSDNINSRIKTQDEAIEWLNKTASGLNDIINSLETTLRAHVNIINNSTSITTKLLQRTLDLIAFAYYKDKNIGELRSGGTLSKPILKGENKAYPEEWGIVPAENLITLVVQLKKALESTGLILEGTYVAEESLDPNETRRDER